MSADDPKRRLSVHDVIGALGDLPEGEDCVSVIRKQRDAADRPSVTDNARAEAWDEGYQDGLRQGGEGEDGSRYVNPYWAAARAETTTATTDEAVSELLERMSDAVTRLEALRAEHWDAPERQRLHGKIEGVKLAASYVEEARGLLATARTVNVHPTYTVEYQRKIADELGVEREAVLRALGLAAPLLATARTHPTRDDLARAIASGYEPDHPTPNRHDYRAADAVLALLRDGALAPTPTTTKEDNR